MASENEARAIQLDLEARWEAVPTIEGINRSRNNIRAALDAAEARERDRWTREVQHRFDTCEARHVDEWRAFAVKMGVKLLESPRVAKP